MTWRQAQRLARQLHTLRADAALQRRAIQRGDTLRKRALAEQVGRIDRPVRAARSRRQAVVHNHSPPLKARQTRLPLAVRKEVNQIEFLQCCLRSRVHGDGGQLADSRQGDVADEV